MRFWWFDPELGNGVAQREFATIDAVFSLDGDLISRDSLSCVLRVECEGKCYYVKRYAGNGKNAQQRWYGLRQWLALPRVKKEWQNLLLFRAWGIPTARIVAYGVERHFGGFRRGALITEEIRGSTDLHRMVLQQDPRLMDRDWVACVSGQVARIARRMHEAGFVHNDLKWRNLLVTDAEPPEVYLIDCPNGEIWRGPFLSYRIVKDLACLDKVAKYQLTRTQRLRFYLEYVRRFRLLAADKARIRRITAFFEGRE